MSLPFSFPMWLRRLAFVLLLVLALVLALTTWVEQTQGTSYVVRHVYHAPWFTLLWVLLALCGSLSLVGDRAAGQSGSRLQLWLLHGALVLILIGAGVSALTSRNGHIHLRQGVTEQAYTPEGENQRLVRLPFRIRLDRFHISHHAGTDEASGYTSEVCIDHKRYTVGMNRVVSVAGYRLFQYAYDADRQGSVLLVRYDPWGRPLTYAGYALLLFAFGLQLFTPRGGMRRNLRALRRLSAVCLAGGLTFSPLTAREASSRPVLSPEAATAFGTLYTSCGGRICPVQTVAQDFCRKLCGTTHYEDFSAEQVLTGFLFWPEAWADVPLIRLPSPALRQTLGLDSPTSYRLLQMALAKSSSAPWSAVSEGHQLCGLVEALHEGTLLRLYPVVHNGRTRWLSRRELEADTTWCLRYPHWSEKANESELMGNIVSLRAAQLKGGGNTLPSAFTLRAERLYNAFDLPFYLSRLLLVCGLVAMGWSLRKPHYPRRAVAPTLWVIGGSGLALTAFLILRSLVSGRLPLGNGYETMLTAAWFSLLIGFPWSFRLRRAPLLPAIPLLASGFFLLVASLTRSGAEISQLVPVLDSPWLQLHVSLVMWAYALLTFTFLLSLLSLLRGAPDRLSVLQSRLLLYPALALLAAGIFTGAVWADFSWGRYWGWDPKEVWALITLLIYALPLHPTSLRPFRSPRFYHLYLLFAFSTVLMTYFGVNYLLGGLHGYVG